MLDSVAGVEERPQPAKPKTAEFGVWLTTKRWLITTVAPAHAGLLARMHARNGHHFAPGMDVRPEMATPAFWTPILEQQQHANRLGHGLFLFGFLKDGSSRPEIGCAISFFGIIHEEFESCWLGYRMDRTLEGQGLMYEALVPAIDKMFNAYGLHRIQASHRPDNLRSGSLLRRLGFGIEGYSRDFMKTNGAWRDNVLLSKINPAD